MVLPPPGATVSRKHYVQVARTFLILARLERIPSPKSRCFLPKFPIKINYSSTQLPNCALMQDRFIEDLKSRIDIVDLIKRYAEVKKSGKNFMCRSPFRNERTPSFSISPDKQMWYDFGSSEGGDAISFVEKIENLSFGEAVEFLADIAGVEIPKTFGENKGPSKKQKQDIFTLHEAACTYFATQLQKSKPALKYLHDRGINDETIKRWALGYGGDGKDGLTKHLLNKNYKEAQIAESGVAFERNFGDKTMMDRFWGRIMIPIREPRNGKIIAFSGRDILDREKVGKYVNSPENPVYHKSSTLFGLDKARKSIKDNDAVILVEGNFDVIMAQEAGLHNTIATCGTALTEDHLRLLRRFTKNIYLAFDNDIAGKKATLKSVEMCLRMGLNPFVIFLPDVKDFGEFLENPDNNSKLKSLAKSAPTALGFFFESFAKKRLDGSLEGEKKFLDNFFYFLKLVDRPIEVDAYLGKVAERLNRNKSVIEAEFKKFSAAKTNYNKPKYVEDTKVQFDRAQNFIGFISAYHEPFKKTLEGQAEKIAALMPDKATHDLMTKVIDQSELNADEHTQVLGWQMWQENLRGTEVPPFETLKKDFEVYVMILEKEKAKQERMEKARNLKI